jgi:hypothetical protein
VLPINHELVRRLDRSAIANGGLFRMLSRVLVNKLADRVLCQLTVDGRAVRHAEHPERILNGLTLTAPRSDGGTDIVLPSTDDVRGADFRMWFWMDLSQLRGASFDEAAFETDSRFS